jgi:long-chain acyl-CoA synthetase
MDKWDAERMLALIEQYRITHTFCVPTMFTRLLRLPDEIRRRYDTSSLRFIITARPMLRTPEGDARLAGTIIWEMFAVRRALGPWSVWGGWQARYRRQTRPGQVRIRTTPATECLPGHAGHIFR